MISNLLQTLYRKRSLFILGALLLISGIAHGNNMFHFPYYENDEGTYMSQAWSLLTTGELAPYTYWYDHAPGGWIFIALWVKLTGGFETFGLSVNSGRIFMLVLHLLSTALLFFIARKITKGNFAGALAGLIFGLSPLGIYFQRRVLLDNIMIFWILLSLALLLKDRLKLSDIVVSALSFGIAVVTKENAVFFGPAFMYVLFAKAHRHHRLIAFVQWGVVAGSVVGFYILYALLKGEFFPPGHMGDQTDHVSLISTLSQQFNRGNNIPFWSSASDFYISLQSWIRRDSLTIIVGGFATIINLLAFWKVKTVRIPVIFVALFWMFLMRGKLVLDFYIIPLMPLLALNIGVLFHSVLKHVTFQTKAIYTLYASVIAVIVSASLVNMSIGQYTRDETTPQVAALNWVLENVPKDAVIAIDDFAEVEYRKNGYVNAAWFWKMWYDPEVQKTFANNWKNIDYLYLSHEMLYRIGLHPDPRNVLRSAYLNSHKVIQFGPTDPNTYVNFSNYTTTNGDWVAIYKLRPEEEILASTSWDYYKSHFIHSYGQVIDPSNGNTTSEGQSYAMLRALWMDDKKTFEGVWNWTRDHMQYRGEDKLLSWLWNGNAVTGSIVDSESAADADEDIALALTMAAKKWASLEYLSSAQEILNDIWEKEVVTINNRHYLISGSGARRETGYLFNPSYLSPASYRIFAQVDPSHPWLDLADDSYEILNELADRSATGLPGNWYLLTNDGRLVSASQYIADSSVDSYGFDAFRTMWRVALDAQWYLRADARRYLDRVLPFYTSEWEGAGRVHAIYNTNGERQVEYESISTTMGALSVFAIQDRALAADVYNKKVESMYHEEGYWSDPNNYFDQNWTWFGSALYLNYLPNIWAK